MQVLLRNTTKFEYLPYTGTESDLNDDGEHTGEFYPDHGEAVEYRGVISSPNGETNQTFYGEDIRYTHVIVMCKPKADIQEHGMIRWKGELYDILAVHRSLNNIRIALKKQTVDHALDPVEPDEPDEPGDDDGDEGDG